MKNYAKVAWVWFKRKTMLTYAITVLFVASLYLWGPYVEVRTLPILTGVRITQVHRVEDAHGDVKGCFAISYRKDRYAIAKYVVFLAVTPSGEQYDTRVTVGSSTSDVPFKTLTNRQVRAVGTVGTYYWCVEVPKDVEGLTLNGTIRYSTWHHQWDLDQELPTITMPNVGDLKGTNYDENNPSDKTSNALSPQLLEPNGN